MTKKNKQSDNLTPEDFPEQPQEQPSEPAVEKTTEQERDELMGRLQRLAADYQNYQKRVQKDVSQARDFANESIMKDLVSVLDDMERALAAAKENHGDEDPFYTGMQMVHDNLLGVLKRHGLEPIDPLGQPFDPEKHAAMMKQPTAEADPMTVLQVVQRGYDLKGRTLRPAGVIVSVNPNEE